MGKDAIVEIPEQQEKKNWVGWAIKRITLIVFDVLAVNGSYFLALLIRFYINGHFREIAQRYLPSFGKFAPIYTVICIVVFAALRLYDSRWNSAGINDLNRVFVANLITAVMHVVATLVFYVRMPISYYILGAITQFLLIAVSRFGYRILIAENATFKTYRMADTNVMIIGVGETAKLVRRQIEHDKDNLSKPVCMFSYVSGESSGMLDGIPVLTNINRLSEYIEKYKIQRVVFADTLIPLSIRKDIKDRCWKEKVEVQDYSGYLRSDDGGISFQRLMEYYNGKVMVENGGIREQYDDAEAALDDVPEKSNVKSISIKDNQLLVELFNSDVKPLTLFYITNNPEVALIAERCGVDRIWIDLETLGKEDRQRNMNTVKSNHTIADISTIKPLLTKAEMLVRINPWNSGSIEEIDAVINAGADMIMLPYWKTVDEVDSFLEAVNHRCKTTLLLETKEAVDCVDDVLLRDFDEIHVGLNDLSLSYGLTFMFELLSDGTVEQLCEKFKKAGIPYGFGGIAKLGSGLLPADKIIMEHYRLGSTRAILSRSFCDWEKIDDIDEINSVFTSNMEILKDYEMSMANVSQNEYVKNKYEVKKSVDNVVAQIMRARNNEE